MEGAILLRRRTWAFGRLHSVADQSACSAKNHQYPPIVFDQPSQPPENNERPAWKDTVISYPETVTRVIARYDLPSAARPRPGQKFRYVYHCHILEHEENEMMRPYDVLG